MSDDTKKPLFTDATRSAAIPLIVFYGESGSGKTYSALLLARGIAQGKPIKGIDTERGRMSLFAGDPAIGPYKTALLEEPYTPERHIEFLDAAEEGAGCLVLDSGSHEWEGPGGVLDWASAIPGEGLHKWKKPKEAHAKFVAKLMRARVPIIVCLRAKYKTRQVKGTKEMADQGLIQFKDVNKNCVVKDQYLSPIQAEDFIFEATVHVQLNPDHTLIVTKGGPVDLRACFPKDNDGMITVEHGNAVARWIAGGGQRIGGPQKPASTAATTPAPADPGAASTPAPTGEPDEAKKLRGQIWNFAKDLMDNDWNKLFADGNKLQQYLWDEGIVSDTEELLKLPVARLSQVLEALKEKFPQT
jgi:hypothetical protein